VTREREHDELPASFDPYVDPPPAAAAGPTAPLQEGDVGLALVMVRAGTPEQLSLRMARVAALAAEHGGSTDAMTSGLLVVSFGTQPQRGPGDRAGFIAALLLDLAAEMKVVHGSEPGHFGTLGGPARFAYGFVLPSFEGALGRLVQLDYGDTAELAGAEPA
jgi:hypothetical protein